MSKDKKTTPVAEAAAGVIKEEVATTEVVSTEEVEITEEVSTEEVETTEEVESTEEVSAEKVATTDVVSTEEVAHEAVLIPSGRFVAENGDEYEFAMNSFTFKGKVYTKEEALSNHSDVLERLVSLKSFILKKL